MVDHQAGEPSCYCGDDGFGGGDDSNGGDDAFGGDGYGHGGDKVQIGFYQFQAHHPFLCANFVTIMISLIFVSGILSIFDNLLYAARQRSCEVVTEYGLEVATPWEGYLALGT